MENFVNRKGRHIKKQRVKAIKAIDFHLIISYVFFLTSAVFLVYSKSKKCHYLQKHL
jgi:hypothetical protein